MTHNGKYKKKTKFKQVNLNSKNTKYPGDFRYRCMIR